ncbi:MAG TPA: magnesium chelatase domain-containing protein, partial [Candidatus Dormibacteraeota bacterium]|nr:magnesium chelatase domain-containing protein [Candidatus Dormibacteraeota bacterium]
MLATLLSATLIGLDGRVIQVEVDVAGGLPGFTIVGLADTALQEARERVRGAIRNAGFTFPPRRITVNLAPAEQRKSGASLDLAIALGILLGSEQVRAGPGRIALVGELSLGGEVRPVPGVLPMTAALARRGLRRIAVPASAVAEASLVGGVEVVGVGSLGEAAEIIRRRPSRRSVVTPPRIDLVADTSTGSGLAGSAAVSSAAVDGDAGSDSRPRGFESPDLVEVRGQLEARRALEIGLAGGHG